MSSRAAWCPKAKWASLKRPQLLEQIHDARTPLDDLRRQHANLTEIEAKGTVREIEMLAFKSTNLRHQIRDYEEQANWLKEKMTNQEPWLERGLITKRTLLLRKQSLYGAQPQTDAARRDSKELGNKELLQRAGLFSELARRHNAPRGRHRPPRHATSRRSPPPAAQR